MNDIVLPFNCNIPIRNDKRLGVPIGILTADPAIGAQIYSNYIQLCFSEEQPSSGGKTAHLGFLPGFDLEEYAALGYLTIIATSTEDIRRASIQEIGDNMVTAIDSRKYIYTDSNEHMQANRLSYPGSSDQDVALLVGFELSRGSFVNISRGAGCDFAVERELMSTYLHRLNARVRRSCAERLTVAYRTVEVCSSAFRETQVATIYEQLRNYFSGASDAVDCWSVEKGERNCGQSRNSKKRMGQYGIKVYECISSHVKNAVVARRPIDTTITQILADHKRVIVYIIEAILGRSELGRDSSRKYSRLVDSAEAINNAAMAFNRSRDQALGYSILPMLARMSQLESTALGTLLAFWPEDD